MFRTLQNWTSRDADLPARAWELSILRRVLDGTLYDVLPYEFHEERTGSGDYIPLALRAPSVRYGLCGTVVDDSVALLFSEGHFPAIEAGGDRALRSRLRDLVRATRLNALMVDAARRGSVGSVCLRLRIMRDRPYIDVLDTTFLTPAWQPDAPDDLARVAELRKASGRSLRDAGYDIADNLLHVSFWFRREWNAEMEIWYVPQPVSNGPASSLRIDGERTTRHGLGFVPMVWIRNMAGGGEIDGGCTFRAAIESGIEIDYQLSQAGRGLKYSSDPTLLIKEPVAPDTEILRGAANALIVSEHGDARLLEIGGTAAQAVIDYVRTLREFALESVHGNRASADRLGAAQSGRALELMNQGLIWLADNLRASYGEDGLLQLTRLILRASQVNPLMIAGERFQGDPEARLSLRWPRWYPADAAEQRAEASALVALRGAGLISRESAVQVIANGYDVEDVGAELAAIASDNAESAREQNKNVENFDNAEDMHDD